MMATSSPTFNGKAGDSAGTGAVINGNGIPQRPTSFDPPKPNLRGLNKPKCIKCGNVARSRCPFQCCKSCCYKAQNPCHIHVLKQSSTLPDKPPPSASPSLEQPSTDSPSTGASWRLGSLKQLSHNVLNSLRTRKPLTKKEIANMNKWRFMKLREHIQGETGVENEAFERYRQNIRLLEETFSLTATPGVNVQPAAEGTSSEDRTEMLVSEAKVRLMSDSTKADGFKERIRSILDQKLKKLQERQHATEDSHPDQDVDNNVKSLKLVTKQRADRAEAVNELLDKLNRARSVDDLKPFLEMRNQLFARTDSAVIDKSNGLHYMDLSLSNQESEMTPAPHYSFPNLWTKINVDEDALSRIGADFLSLSQIAQL